MEPKQVIIVRKDLNMRKGKMIAQGSHASMKVFLDRNHSEQDDLLEVKLDEYMSDWINGLFTKVVVSVNSEEELLELKKQADEKNIINALIQDVGKTEFDGVPTYTCLAIGPHDSEQINEITGHLKLL